MRPRSLALRSRLAAFLRSWPGTMTRTFRQEVGVRPPGRRARPSPGPTRGPIWLELPGWLLERYEPGFRRDPRSRRMLDAILWGQYCLFLVVRIQDDLFDGHVRQPSLLFAADQFLIESQRVFAEDLRSGPAFGRIYRQCLRDTTLAIVEIDRLQRSRRGVGAASLDHCSRQSSIFKVAPAWLCLRFRRMKEYPRISRFLDGIAVADQILDDLTDMEEDHRGGRLNFAVRRLMEGAGQSRKRGRKPPLLRAAEGALFHDGLSDLFSSVRQRIDAASAAISPLRISPAEDYIRRFRAGLDRYEGDIHRRRVRLLLGDLLAHR